MQFVQLGSVSEFIMGQAPHSNTYNKEGNGTLLIKAGDFKLLYPTPEEFTTNPISFSKTGDILICVVGATCGKVNLAIDASITRSIAAIRPNKERLNDKYLFLFLKTNYHKINKLATGSAQGIISKPILYKIEIPLPAFLDQIQLAKILTQAETLISQRKKSIRLLDELLKSTFWEMFGDYFNSGTFFKLSDLCSKITDGTHYTPERLTEGVKFITGKHIRPFVIDYKNSDYVTKEVHEEIFKRCNPEYGDILYTNIGVNLGTAAMNIVNYEFSMKNVALLKPIPSKLHPRYLEHLLNNEKQKNKIINDNSSGGAQKFLSLGQIKSIKIPVPKIEFQMQFAQIVEKVEALKVQYHKSLVELQNMYGVLCQKAFKGELNLDNAKQFIEIPIQNKIEKIILNIPENKKTFAKQVLGGKIVSLFKDDTNFTHIKFQKLQYLAENCIEADLNWNYYRLTAGPYDPKFMNTVASRLKALKWFEEKKYKFYPLEKTTQIDGYYNSYFGKSNERLNELFSLLKNASEKFCEAIATIYAVWNNHIILKQQFDKEKIKQDFFKWSTRKDIVFNDEEFEKALQWMQKNKIVPTGFGQLIKEKIK